MPPPPRHSLSLDERLANVEGDVSELRRDVRALTDGETVRNSRAKLELDAALEGAKTHIERVVSVLRTENKDQSAVLAKILSHSEEAASERRRRVAREDAKLDEEIREGSRRHLRLMLKVVGGVIAAVIVAWLGAAASHVNGGAAETHQEK